MDSASWQGGCTVAMHGYSGDQLTPPAQKVPAGLTPQGYQVGGCFESSSRPSRRSQPHPQRHHSRPRPPLESARPETPPPHPPPCSTPPKQHPAPRTAPPRLPAGSPNCGMNARKNAAVFGFSASTSAPSRNACPAPIAGPEPPSTSASRRAKPPQPAPRPASAPPHRKSPTPASPPAQAPPRRTTQTGPARSWQPSSHRPGQGAQPKYRDAPTPERTKPGSPPANHRQTLEIPAPIA